MRRERQARHGGVTTVMSDIPRRRRLASGILDFVTCKMDPLRLHQVKYFLNRSDICDSMRVVRAEGELPIISLMCSKASTAVDVLTLICTLLAA